MDMLAQRKTAALFLFAVTSLLACGGSASWSDPSNGGPAGGTNNGTGGLLGGEGGANTGGSPTLTATGQTCTGLGTVRYCCVHGTQTCENAGEFFVWGTCVDPSGTTLTCGSVGGCSASEAPNPLCDGGASDGPAPPPPTPPTPPPAVCNDPALNNEPEILVGYSPGMGQTVGLNGQVKVWVNDESSPFIAPGEMVDNTTGAIAAPGNRATTASDGLLYEPALYIAPQSPTNGGTPHFPQWIKGSYNNNPPTRGSFTGGATIDPAPPGASFTLRYSAEFIWDVSALGLTPGTYTAVFSVHDGDHDRAIACITLVITS
jgi:hypothetical protein